jgi:hypothetical protein
MTADGVVEGRAVNRTFDAHGLRLRLGHVSIVARLA